MTILVTTPNGKVGSEVIRLLVEQGVPVRVGAHTVEKQRRHSPARISFILIMSTPPA